MPVADSYQAFSFTPEGQETLLLAGVLESFDHELGARLASFEYLKRDGAEVEPMGASQARLAYRVVLLGDAPLTPGGAPLSAGARYLKLAQTQRAQPRGLLNDPRLGRWRVGWTKLHAHEQPQRAVDTIELSLEFVEDQVDAAIAAEIPTPQARAGEMVDAYSILKAAVALRFAGSPSALLQGVLLATDALANVADAFVTSALEVAQGLRVNPTLEQQFGAVERAANVVLQSLASSLAYTLEPEVSLTPYRHQAYMTIAYGQLLMQAVAEQKPTLLQYVLPVAMSFDAVLLSLYGSDAANHFDEMLSLNRIATPLLIPQGTVLTAVTPQVRQ